MVGEQARTQEGAICMGVMPGRRFGLSFAAHDFVLTPGRYVGAEDVEEDGEPFAEKMERLVGALREQQAEGRRLDVLIGQALGGLGW
jgi:type I restriction-modification system DNA methylase subunit